jgi:hypothetical protein
LLGEITGGGSYDDILPNSLTLKLHSSECLCLGLEYLIKVKRGRRNTDGRVHSPRHISPGFQGVATAR